MAQQTGVRQFFTLPPLSRIVSGSPTFYQDKDNKGQPKKHPNWFMMVAVPKDPNPQGHVNQVLQLGMAVAWHGYAQYPQIQAKIQAGLNSGFSWKIEDGDAPDNRDKPGRAGCWLFKFSTSIGAMKCCDANGVEIDPAMVKCGYYVTAQGSFDVNGQTDHTAGLYVNPSWIRLDAIGQEITSGPSARDAVANMPPVGALPPGATPFTGAGAAAAPTNNGAFGQQQFQPQFGQQQQQLPPPQQQQQQPAFQTGAPASGQGAPGFATGAPAGSTPASGYTGTAFPSNQAQQQYPGATPNTGFAGVPPR